jgi:hypothetical protein
MPTLIVKAGNDGDRSIDLAPGFNTVGRSPSNDFPIEHPSVSDHHCVISVMGGEITIRDLDSTNGSFIDGEQIKQASLYEGQTLRLGEVELVWERSEVVVVVPRLDEPRRAPESVLLADGALSCVNHASQPATRHCARCDRFYCGRCVTHLRRVGGSMHHLCPACSGECEWIGPRRRKNSILGHIKHALGRLFSQR